jgi:glutathione synthase/RimK-type ligase-like ATP-grasp enzyme
MKLPDPVIVVEKRSDYRWSEKDPRVITAQEFISEGPNAAHRPRKVINLCRSFSYCSIGYYVSLLAEARGEHVTPGVETIVEMHQKSVALHKLRALDNTLGTLDAVPRSVTAMSVQVCFGRIEDGELSDLAAAAFDAFRCPLLCIDLDRMEGNAGWSVAAIKSIDPRDLDDSRDELLRESLDRFTRRRWKNTPTSSATQMDLAILHDPSDPLPPSNSKTLQAIVDIGRSMNIAVELIEKRDYPRLMQFDALFIRETTAVSHHTFRFAKKAQAEGMPVIDDPESILRCTNKAFLFELLSSHGVGTPPTRLVTRRTLSRLEGSCTYPVVLKVPDGAFSLAVKKAADWADLERTAGQMLKKSDIILVQDYLYTPFDWRIGVLNGEILFAAKYFMVADHWQIISHGQAGSHVEGRTQAIPVGAVPSEVAKNALQAARLIGDGFYGVDLKEMDQGVFVIEINDNPNLDIGMEDAAEGEVVYVKLLSRFQALFDERHQVRDRRQVVPAPSLRLVTKVS